MTGCRFSPKQCGFSMRALMVFITSLFATAASAAAAPSVFLFPQSNLWNPVATVMAGASFSSDVGRSRFYPSPNPATDEYFNYAASGGTRSVPLLGLFLGTEMLLHPLVRLQVGVNYAQPFAYNAGGTLTQGAAIIGTGLPDPNVISQYNYSYNISVHQILAQTKLLFDMAQRFHPFVTAGIGASINKAFNFQSGVTPPNTTLSNNFQNHTNTAFSYSAGLGVDVDVMSHVRVGVGYRFTNYGVVVTGQSIINAGGTNNNGVYNPPVTSTNQLTQSHLYANEVMAQFTFMMS